MCKTRMVKWSRAGLVACSLILLPIQGLAQDMQFGLEETGAAPAGPPPEGPPSEALVNALRLYEDERYPEAAVQLQRVVEGETADAGGNVQKAQFYLGKSLYHLHYYQSALAVFDEISEVGRAHLFFTQTLQWLAQLASQLPEPAGLVDKIGRFGVTQLDQINLSESEDLYNQLIYMMGRAKYKQGEYDDAVNLFRRVAASSRWYVKARFFEGVAHIGAHRAQPAAQAFLGILDGLERGRLATEDSERMRDLAWISLARVYYTLANSGSTADEMRGKYLGNAVHAWNMIDPESEYWLDALFEASWAFFRADEYSRALGNIHTLFSPYFRDAFYPEAMVLKAVVFFTNCQMTNATAVVQQFHERYDPVQAKLDEILGRYRDNNEFYGFLKELRDGRGAVPEEVRGIISSALSDRAVLSNLEYVEMLEAEEAQLNQAPAAFRNSSLGARILQDILLARSYAIDQAGDTAKSRYQALIEEMQDLANQIDTVEIEVLNYERGQLNAALQGQLTMGADLRGGDVRVSPEHNVWPFDGEYWRDELGYYRQQVTYRCGR